MGCIKALCVTPLEPRLIYPPHNGLHHLFSALAIYFSVPITHSLLYPGRTPLTFPTHARLASWTGTNKKSQHGLNWREHKVLTVTPVNSHTRTPSLTPHKYLNHSIFASEWLGTVAERGNCETLLSSACGCWWEGTEGEGERGRDTDWCWDSVWERLGRDRGRGGTGAKGVIS